MRKLGNSPAMPCVAVEQAGDLRQDKVVSEGLTKREEFAGRAMAALLASGDRAGVAQKAINYADDLLEKLEQTK